MATFTLRLSDDEDEAPEAMALLAGQPKAVVVRDAVRRYVAKFATGGGPERCYEEAIRARSEAARTLRSWSDRPDA
jgi:Ribbon-helix-helix protein, copG family